MLYAPPLTGHATSAACSAAAERIRSLASTSLKFYRTRIAWSRLAAIPYNEPEMKLAVLGLGFMGSTHVAALRGLPGVELAAVYSSDENKLAGDLTGVGGNLGTGGQRMDFSSV